MAVTCGTPTPATTRVVQIEPGPTPTLTASTPASTSAWAPARVATLPPMTWTWRVAGSDLSRRTMSSISRAWPLAVSATRTSTPASTRVVARSHASPKKPMAAPTSSRPWSSLLASGNCSDFTKSLTVISPARRPSPSTSGSRSRLCWRSRAVASSREMPTATGDERHRGHHVAHQGGRPLGDRGEAQVAVGDHAEQVVALVDDGQAGHAVLAAAGGRAPRAWRRGRS